MPYLILQKIIASYKGLRHLCPMDSTMAMLFTGSIALLLSLSTPTIKLRLRDDQLEAFKETSIPGRVVLVTDKHLSSFNMGVLGSLKNGIRLSLSPLFRQPVKVLTGMAYVGLTMTASVGITFFFPRFVAAHKTAILAGIFFALV